MFLLNLSLGQLLALVGATSALVVALYLLDRTRHRQIVATLRFWTSAAEQAVVRHRRRIQQPLSLLLQLLGIALLLLAVAQLRLGTPGRPPRDHVVILDTSAWMGARAGRAGSERTLMDEARSSARFYVRALPSVDRVMLVRADALATPATGFESNRKILEQAIARSSPGATGLNLKGALEFAREAQKLHARRDGEIVYVGPGRVDAPDTAAATPDIPNLRVLPVGNVVENCGIRKVGLRRSSSDLDLWEVFIAMRNYGSKPRAAQLALRFDGALLGTRRVDLVPGSDQSTTFELRTRASGTLEAELVGGDAFAADDRAVLELPAQRALRVVVYSNEPELLRPVLEANPRVTAVFHSPAQYDPNNTRAAIMVFDGWMPTPLPPVNCILIEPPAGVSPVAVRATVNDVKLVRWRSDHELGAGLNAKDVRLEQAQVYRAAPGDIDVADVDAGPVIVARAGKPKLVVLGFHPTRSAMRYELATPLLFANILAWMSPEVFRRWELNAGTAGVVDVTLDPNTDPSAVSVVADTGEPVPFTIQGRTLRLFAATPQTLRIAAGDRELVYSLTLPEVADIKWEPPRHARHGIPSFAGVEKTANDLWPLLASLGALSLFVEWWLFGRRKTSPFGRRATRVAVIPMSRLRSWVAASTRKAR